MKKMLWLTLLLVGVMLVGGCKSTSSGSREFVPGKGWIHTD